MPLALPLPRTAAARFVYAALAVGAAVAAVAVSSPWVLALWLLPDLALVGAFNPAVQGHLHPRAVARYNAVHSFPPALAAAAVGFVVSPLLAGIGLVWLSHIAMDRAAGYGLRAPDGGQRAV